MYLVLTPCEINDCHFVYHPSSHIPEKKMRTQYSAFFTTEQKRVADALMVDGCQVYRLDNLQQITIETIYNEKPV